MYGRAEPRDDEHRRSGVNSPTMQTHWAAKGEHHMAAIWSAPRGERLRAPRPVAPRAPGFTTIWRAIVQPARSLLGYSHALAGESDRARDATAFDRLFEQHEPQIFGYLYRMTG